MNPRPPALPAPGPLALGLLALVALLAGCAPGILPPRSLETGPDVSDRWGSASVAVRADGDQDYGWSELAGGHDQVVQARVHMGLVVSRTSIIPSGAEDYRSPRLATSDAGSTYLVWQGVTESAPQLRRDCWEVLPPGDGAATCRELAGAAAAVDGLPRVAARGNAVYAVYATPGETGADLRYRQLALLDRSAGAVAAAVHAAPRRLAGLGVDVAGNLYVSWLEDAAGGAAALLYNDNAGTTADMLHARTVFAGQVSGAGMAVDNQAAATAYLAYVDATDAAAHQLYLVHCDAGCGSTGSVPLLDPGQGWQIEGDPAVAADADGAYVAFAATREGLDLPEIWLVTYRGGVTAAPTRITDNSWSDGPPQAGTMALGFVIAWRTVEAPGRYRDAYVYDPVHGVRQIFVSPPGAAPSAFWELATRDAWAAGVWADRAGEGEARLVPWYSFNVYRSALAGLPLARAPN